MNGLIGWLCLGLPLIGWAEGLPTPPAPLLGSPNTWTQSQTFKTVNLDGSSLAPRDSLVVAPIGNPLSTLSKWSLHSRASSSAMRSFMVDLGEISSTSGGTGMIGGNVVLYTGMEAVRGSGDAWSFNPLLTIDAGAGANTHHFQAVELDFNNNDVDSQGITFANGLDISGAGLHIANTALGIYGNRASDNGPAWLYGIQCGANNSVSIACIEIEGKSGFGIDFINFSGAESMRLKNNSPVEARNAAGSKDLSVLNLDAHDVLQIGMGAAGLYSAAPRVEFPGNVVNGNTFTATVVESGHLEDTNFTIQDESNGGRYTLPVDASHTNIHATATLASLIITEPTGPANGQVACVATDQAITALTLRANAGQSILGIPSSLAAGARDCHRFRSLDSTWYPY